MDIQKLKEDLIRDEGKVLYAYQDTLGYWTIGVGHLIDKRKGGGLPDAVVEMLLLHDIDEKIEACRKAFSWFDELDDARQRVIVNMAFNLGIDGLKKFKRMLSAIENKDYSEAARQMLDSVWAKQVGIRATRLANLMKYGV